MQAKPTALVDVDALVRHLVSHTYRTAAEQLLLGIEWLEQNDGDVTYSQQLMLAEAMLHACEPVRRDLAELVEEQVDEPLRWKFSADPNVRALLDRGR